MIQTQEIEMPTAPGKPAHSIAPYPSLESTMIRIPDKEFAAILDALKALVLVDEAPQGTADKRKALAAAEQILERYGEEPMTPGEWRQAMEALFKGERLYGAAFVPRVGEHVVFRSDLQTEKGPSAGSVIAVDRDARTATIQHSDHPGQTFRLGDVKVAYFVIARDGSPLWVLE